LIHVHTRASDGSAEPREIAAEAARAGVEAVILTDHDRISPGAGWQDGVLVVPGQEVTPRHNHLLALGLDQSLPKFRGDGVNGDPARSLALIQKLGGWAALAHPLDSAIPSAARSRSFVTLDFSAIDCPGLELWNAMSAFKRDMNGFGSFLARVLMPTSFLAGPEPVLLALWDAVGRRRRWVAFAGADAHAFSVGKRWLPLKVFSYRRHMRLLLTGLWLGRPFSGDFQTDQALVLEALTQGRCFASLGRARGFSCRLRGPAGSFLPGAELAFSPGGVMEVELPARGEVRLIHNGRLAQKARGRRFAWPLDQPGVWRVEARRWRAPAGWRPWIYCNPFYLREAA
jgi:hypothetical protein